MNAIVEVRNVTYGYLKGVDVLHDISFCIEKGEFVSLIGHNGSGKSTLAKVLSILVTPQKGEVIINGEKITKENVNKIRSIMGIVFQNPDNQFIGATVEDDIAFGLENKNVPYERMKELVYTYAKKVGMEKFLDKAPSEISGGQKQRVAIAGVLALGLKLIIFDESTAMLDPEGIEEINNLIKEIREEDPEITFISITHHIEDTLNSDKIIVLNKGEIYLQGTPSEVYKDEATLKNIGLDAPFFVKIKNALKKNGVKVDGKIKDLESLSRFLCK